MWRANAKAWVTRQLFIDWVNVYFGSTVRKYLEENRLPMKCVLVLESAPAHPPGLEEYLLAEYSCIKVMYLPPNTTPLLKAMEQQVISNFKKLYTKHLFQRYFKVTESTKLTLREFWKDHFNISKVADIVHLGTSMGLEASTEDIDELIEEHHEELTTDDLKELETMEMSVIKEQFSSGDEEDVTPLKTTVRDGGTGLDKIGDGNLAVLDYADDADLLSKAPQDLQCMLTRR
ncbi:tigger transposable element-derived protein 1-like [Palaemon carinicauda]|uniref:tigger transposable element-derived protein 1-like n=1 Tax=Palaemon carinicauda TaxID=392227 RepID=UPI0035B63EE6